MKAMNDLEELKEFLAVVSPELLQKTKVAVQESIQNPSPENYAKADQLWELLSSAQLAGDRKATIEAGRFSHVPIETQQQFVRAATTFLENPSEENKALADAWWQVVVATEDLAAQHLPPQVNSDTPSREWRRNAAPLRWRNVIAALGFGCFFIGSQIGGISIISPARVPPLGELPIGARGALLLVTAMFFVLMLTLMQRSGENMFPVDSEQTFKGMEMSRRNRVVFLLLGTIALFQGVFVVPIVLYMLNGALLTPSIMLPAFAIVPLSALMIGLAFAGGILRGGRFSFKNPFLSRYGRIALLVVTGITILMAGLLRWLVFSFINVESYYDAVDKGTILLLPAGTVDTALMAHAMLFAALLLFVTCVVIYLEYVSLKTFSWVAIVLTIICAIYSGLFVFGYRALFLPNPDWKLDFLENAHYVLGVFSYENPFAYNVMKLSLFFDIGGLVYIVVVALRSVWNAPDSRLNVYRLALAFVILVSELLEIIALLNAYGETSLSVPLNFPYLEIALTAGIVLIALELTLGRAAPLDITQS